MRFNVDLKDGPVIGPLAEVLRRTGAVGPGLRDLVLGRGGCVPRAGCCDRPVCMAASPFGISVVRFGGPRGPRDQRRPAQPPRGGHLMLADRLARTGVRCAQVPAAVATPAFVGPGARAGAGRARLDGQLTRTPWRRLLDLGVDGIMTDETVALRDVLISRGQWHPRPVRLTGRVSSDRDGWNRAQRES